jgi:hypothetical protein
MEHKTKCRSRYDIKYSFEKYFYLMKYMELLFLALSRLILSVMLLTSRNIRFEYTKSQRMHLKYIYTYYSRWRSCYSDKCKTEAELKILQACQLTLQMTHEKRREREIILMGSNDATSTVP